MNAMSQTPSCTRPDANQSLPFFYCKDGKAIVMSADGTHELPDDWTGLVSGPDGVYSLWFLGREGGERSFNKLAASVVHEAQAEISARFPAH